MIVYHGSTIVVQRPLAAAGRVRLDFGQGFYVTDIKAQAESWADRMQRIRQEQGVVNVYELDIDAVKATFRYFRFTDYDEKWLEFIIANRLGKEIEQRFDLVEGGVANDRVIDTVEAFMANMMPLNVALRELSRHKPNNQLCIANQAILDNHLTFVESYLI